MKTAVGLSFTAFLPAFRLRMMVEYEYPAKCFVKVSQGFADC